jgi:hypothetical protein
MGLLGRDDWEIYKKAYAENQVDFEIPNNILIYDWARENGFRISLFKRKKRQWLIDLMFRSEEMYKLVWRTFDVYVLDDN